MALLKYEPGAVSRAIDMCQGLAALRPGDRVLLKPNLVAWNDRHPFPPYGVLTTTTVVEQTLAAVKDAGASEIVIGEGSIINRDLGSSTQIVYERLNYERLARRYGVRLVDLNQGPFQETSLVGHPISVAKEALETDFLVTLPVLKTHEQAKVSLGMKNLKGTLKVKSKKLCHRADRPLDDFLVALADLLSPDLTIIDGIYRLSSGAMRSGTTTRTDLIIAGKDILATDLVGAYLLGFNGAGVIHLADYAAGHGRSTDLADIEVLGLNPEEFAEDLPYRHDWTPDNTGPVAFAKQGLTGIALPELDMTLCTGCSLVYNPLAILLLSANEGKPFPGYEILTGKSMEPRPGYEKTFLVGNCQIKYNRKHNNIKEAVYIKGCPPSIDEIIRVFNEHGVAVKPEALDRFGRHLKKIYSDTGIFKPEDFWPVSQQE